MPVFWGRWAHCLCVCLLSCLRPSVTSSLSRSLPLRPLHSFPPSLAPTNTLTHRPTDLLDPAAPPTPTHTMRVGDGRKRPPRTGQHSASACPECARAHTRTRREGCACGRIHRFPFEQGRVVAARLGGPRGSGGRGVAGRRRCRGGEGAGGSRFCRSLSRSARPSGGPSPCRRRRRPASPSTRPWSTSTTPGRASEGASARASGSKEGIERGRRFHDRASEQGRGVVGKREV